MKKQEKEIIIKVLTLIKKQLNSDGFRLYGTGICRILGELSVNRDITKYEYVLTDNYIDVHRPIRGIHYDKERKLSLWWWKLGYAEPRIAWIDYTIEKLSK